MLGQNAYQQTNYDVQEIDLEAQEQYELDKIVANALRQNLEQALLQQPYLDV